MTPVRGLILWSPGELGGWVGCRWKARRRDLHLCCTLVCGVCFCAVRPFSWINQAPPLGLGPELGLPPPSPNPLPPHTVVYHKRPGQELTKGPINQQSRVNGLALSFLSLCRPFTTWGQKGQENNPKLPLSCSPDLWVGRHVLKRQCPHSQRGNASFTHDD